MYFVFDCTKSEGHAFSTPFAFIATIGALVLTKWNGRVYDFEKMPCS